MSGLKYLLGYPEHVLVQVQKVIDQGKLGEVLQRKYGDKHEVRTDKALYDYVLDLKARHMRNADAIHKVVFDGKLKAKREIRVAALFKDTPPEFLKMIVVHELAHLKEKAHDKAFYQLCLHMEPDYHQHEFDLRLYLTNLELSDAA